MKIISLVSCAIIGLSLSAKGDDANTFTHTRVDAKCPDNMVYINGDFCPNVEQTCIKLDKSVHNVNGFVRCLTFAPTKCLSKKLIHMEFCIDKYEASDKLGDLPPVMVSWVEAKNLCENQSKRLCVDVEWTLACEGPDMLPYPYGLNRDSSACNIDHQQKAGFDAAHSDMSPKVVAQLDQRVPSGSMPRCISSYGVSDTTGNDDEATINSSGKPFKNSLKGGHWVLGARNRCRVATTAHNEVYKNYETSYRCCKDIKN